MSVYAFGQFKLFVAERRLERDGRDVGIGSRALDILTVLIENAGTPVSKAQIARRVWPGVIVGETSLRFQIVGLRKLLGDDSERVIATLPGRGYCFVAPLSPASPAIAIGVLPPAPPDPLASPNASNKPRPSLPARLSRMVGRETELVQLDETLHRHRFVTIVGAGGIGKTTLAIATAHRFSRENACDVAFMDLGAVREPERVATALSAALGVSVDEEDALPGLLTYLRSRRLLIVLDCCEHLIEAVATLAERLFQELAEVQLLATSREALRAEGEQVFMLSPFAFPAEHEPVTLGELLEFPSARLLIERAMAAGSELTLAEGDAPVIAEICRRLDGIALAIELAAGRVPTYGLHGTVALLSDRFRHLRGGKRTAIPRHRTLQDTLAWSYELLDQRARRVLQRLCVFVGEFEIEASVIVADREGDEAAARDIVEELVAKSLLAIHRNGDLVTYRLLDTMRAYLQPRFEECDDIEAVRRRHALFYSTPKESASIPNLRAALAWCFSPRGDAAIGVTLAATAAPVFLRTSLLTECVEVCQKALATIGKDLRGTHAELELQACLGQSLMFTAGNTSEVESAFESALSLAHRLGEPIRELQLLGALHLFHERNADFGKAMEFARRAFELAERTGNDAYIAAAHSLLGLAWHLHGEHARADRHLELAMRSPAGREVIDPIGFGFDHRNRACITRARSLWIQGQSDEGAALARCAVEDSAALGHPVTHCIALIWAFSVSEWRNDLDSMQEYVDRFVAHAERHALRPYRPLAECMKGQVQIRRGEASAGIETIEHHMAALRAARYELLNTGLLCTMADGMLAIGDPESAMAIIVGCEASVRRRGDRIHLPEVLRIRASAATALGHEGEAASLLREALDCARMQGARAWELRIEKELRRLGLAMPSSSLERL